MANKARKRFEITPILTGLAKDYCSRKRQASFKGALLIAIQHILGTTADMLSVMHRLGLRDVVIGGKSYSTHIASVTKIKKLGFDYIEDEEQLGFGLFDDAIRRVVYKIWALALQKIKRKKYRRIIILDDGFDLLRATPPELIARLRSGSSKQKVEVVGIEQTRAGSRDFAFEALPFPIINVAGSFVKTNFEYPYVAELIVQRLSVLIETKIKPILHRLPVVGVIGCGMLGQAVAKKLVEKNISVLTYEKMLGKRKSELEKNVKHCRRSETLIDRSDIIIGCTGTDVTADSKILSALLFAVKPKWLVSASSKDREFNSLLIEFQKKYKTSKESKNVLHDFSFLNQKGFLLTVIQGGFPINFFNSEHSVPPEYIWPTRACLLLACLSALQINGNSIRAVSQVLMFDPFCQCLIFNALKKYQHPEQNLYLKMSMQEIKNVIKKESEGNL